MLRNVIESIKDINKIWIIKNIKLINDGNELINDGKN